MGRGEITSYEDFDDVFPGVCGLHVVLDVWRKRTAISCFLTLDTISWFLPSPIKCG